MEIDIQSINDKIRKQATSFETLGGTALSKAEVNLVEKYHPQNSLVIYGTLAPGRPNHSKIEHVKGMWRKGTIKGKLVNEGWGAAMGYPAFEHVPENKQETIEAYILISDELGKHWDYLDKFEGEGYIRILTKYELETGEIGIGNIYAFN